MRAYSRVSAYIDFGWDLRTWGLGFAFTLTHYWDFHLHLGPLYLSLESRREP